MTKDNLALEVLVVGGEGEGEEMLDDASRVRLP